MYSHGVLSFSCFLASFSPSGSKKKASIKDEKEAPPPGYGGVYLGPASDILHQTRAAQQGSSSNPPSRTQSQKRKEKEAHHDSPAKTAKGFNTFFSIPLHC